jgi:hypothetical protein
MTLTIQRQGRLQRLAIALGFAAILTMAALAAIQNTKTDPVDALVPKVSVDTVTPRSGAQQKAFEGIQDDYLPPIVTPESAARKAFLAVQDDYLPPILSPAIAELDPTGSSDNRTNGPR